MEAHCGTRAYPGFGITGRSWNQFPWGYWGTIVYLKCAKWWSDICMHCEMIMSIKLIKTSIASHSYPPPPTFFFFLVRMLTIWSPSKFQVYNIINYNHMWYLKSSKLIHHTTESLYPSINISPFHPPLQTLAITILLSVFMGSTIFVFFQIPLISGTIQYMFLSLTYFA